MDNDGRIDLIVMDQNQPLAYFHNATERAGNFITFRLQGTRSNRDGIGAQLVLSVQGQRQTAFQPGGGSYLSACDGRIHLGVGEATEIDSVDVLWPSGNRDRWETLAVNTGYLLREGDRSAKPLPG